jgi:hypothetical protein
MDKVGYESGNSRQTEAPAPIKRSRIEMMDDGSLIPPHSIGHRKP